MARVYVLSTSCAMQLFHVNLIRLLLQDLQLAGEPKHNLMSDANTNKYTILCAAPGHSSIECITLDSQFRPGICFKQILLSCGAR